jgi:hypothetical protein
VCVLRGGVGGGGGGGGGGVVVSRSFNRHRLSQGVEGVKIRPKKHHVFCVWLHIPCRFIFALQHLVGKRLI